MATKEEHLRELEQEDRDFAAKCREESWLQHREQRAIALAERDEAREELAKLKAAQPSPAPVVGGVTELMLDEIQHLLDRYPYCPGVDEKASAWLTIARDAIRAQKRVDVEAIRSLAHALPADYRYGKKVLLQAIGDEPAEAPVNSPGIQDGSIAEAPVAEPAAPAQEQEWPRAMVRPLRERAEPSGDDWALPRSQAEPASSSGPFTFDFGGAAPCMYIRRGGKIDMEIVRLHETIGEELAALLNAGLEAPNLRARVAELDRHASNYAQSYQEEKARADAAEETLRLVRSDLDQLSGKYREKLRELKSAKAKLRDIGAQQA